MMDRPLKEGDVFKSPEIINKQAFCPNGQDSSETDDFSPLEKTLVQASDNQFVVIKTEKTGGGQAGPHDHYPDGHYVSAKLLSPSGVWDEDGMIVAFYQTGGFISQFMLNPSEVEYMRTMKLQYV